MTHLKSEMQKKLIQLANALPCGICLVLIDDCFTILGANSFYYGIYGYSPEQAAAVDFTVAKIYYLSPRPAHDP